MAFQKNTAQDIQIACYDGETPTAPVNPVVTVSTDGGGFGAATNAPSVVGTTVHITLTASEMNGDAVAVNVASDNLEAQLEIYYPEADYTATIAGRIDAAISSRSSHAAADIWSVGTRTLTSFGSLVSDIWSEAVRTITGGSVDDVNGHSDIPTAAEVDTELTSSHGAGSWNKGGIITLSGGSTDITVTGDGDVVGDSGHIRVTRDDDTDIAVEWEDQDVTGYTIYLTVRPDKYSDSADDTDAIFQISASINNAADGQFSFAISKTETDECEVGTTYWYDIAAFDGSGNQTTLIKRRFSVTGDVTRRTS